MEENFLNIWEKVLDLVKDEVSEVAYKTFIEILVPRLIDDNTICLLTTSNYYVDRVKAKYLDLIHNALKILTSIDYKIVFEVKATVPDNEDTDLDEEFVRGQYGDVEGPNGEKLNPILDLETIRKNAGLNKEYTFDNFVVGSNNRFAAAQAIAVKNNLGAVNPLYIYGGVGLGKTHLMQAIGNAVIEEDPSKRVLYCPGKDFVEELVNDILKGKRDDLQNTFKKKFRNLDLLLIDDVQIIAGKQKSQEEFFHTFNALCESGKQVVLSSERPPNEIGGLEDRLKSRFLMGVSVDVQTPDYETRIAILKKKAQEKNFEIKDEFLEKIAEKAKTNVRVLEGVIKGLITHVQFYNVELTDEIVDHIIEAKIVKDTNVLSSTLVMQVVAKFFNLPVTDLISDKRSTKIAYPRQIAMFLCREVADMSFPAIGNDFGGRDHSTVLHAYSKIQEKYDNDKEARDLIDDIKNALQREG